jgi:hypothetical protein
MYPSPHLPLRCRFVRQVTRLARMTRRAVVGTPLNGDDDEREESAASAA